MTYRLRRSVCFAGICCAITTCCLLSSVRALDTPNVLMTIDGMTMLHAGLFRNATPADGFNTFQFGPIAFAAGPLGRYTSFYFVKNGTGDGGISHNARINGNTPEHWNGTQYQTVAPLDVTSAYLPVIDRALFGQRFDPDQYEIEVKFKPNIGVQGLPTNAAPFFTVGLDQQFGYVWDVETASYKRAAEQVVYNIGAADNPINTWFETAPKDADGFATWRVPVTQPSFSHRSFYHNYGDGDFRTQNVVTGGGRMQNPDGTWADVLTGYGPNFQQFGGGPSDPSRPGSKLNVPNGVPLIAFGAPAAETGLSLQVRSISLKKIESGPILARIDSNSGLTFRFGSGLTRSNTATPINVPNDPFGLGYLPVATDQISRFDQNGMTNLFINMRTPDNPNEVHRFFIRGGPGAQSFDGTSATVNVRARLTEPLANAGIAQNLTLVAKELDGNDQSAGQGADEYTYNLALNQFNTSTFTTVSIPLSQFVRGQAAPFGFTNMGDELLTNFDLYEFGGLIPSGGGMLRMELEYMEIRAAAAALAGDYNSDGKVDAADYAVWRNNPASFGGQGGYDSWKANFGKTAAGSGSAANFATVPEPAAWMLTVLAVTVLNLIRRRSH